jgi:hypothetical protein
VHRLALVLESESLWKVQDDTARGFLLYAMAALHDLTPDQLKLATATLQLICNVGAAVQAREMIKGGAR